MGRFVVVIRTGWSCGDAPHDPVLIWLRKIVTRHRMKVEPPRYRIRSVNIYRFYGAKKNLQRLIITYTVR